MTEPQGESKLKKRLDYDRIAPAGMKAMGGVYGYVSQTSLPPALVDLVYLRISQINNCAYCLDLHTRHLLERGEGTERLALLQAWGLPLGRAGRLRSPRGPPVDRHRGTSGRGLLPGRRNRHRGDRRGGHRLARMSVVRLTVRYSARSGTRLDVAA